WPAEQVARLDAERRKTGEELEQKLFDPQLTVELELPYRLGPLAFLQSTRANDPFSTRLEIEKWPESLRPQLLSVADRFGTQVVFFAQFYPGWEIEGTVPKSVGMVD